MRKDKELIALFIASFLLLAIFFSVNIRQEKIIIKQNEIIALQSEQIFNHQNTAAIQETYIKEQKEVLTVYQDIIDFHDLMTEWNDE